MTTAKTTAADPKWSYEGSELELFRHAVNWKRYLHANLAPHLRGDVLEVGAGIGATARSLCDGKQKSWTCLEPDETNVRALRAELAAHPLPTAARAVRGTLADLGEEATFDTIIYVDVLEHIERDAEEMARASRRLNPGGRIVVLSPAHQWLYTPFDAAIGHFRRYDAASLRAVAPPGLHETAVRYLDSFGLLASLGNRLFLKASMPTAAQIRFWDSVLVPVSTILDRLLFHCWGKSILAVWQKS